MQKIQNKTKKLVAVVVPLSNRAELNQDEKISMRHLVHFLGKYDKYLVIPPNLDVSYQDFRNTSFPDRFFGSIKAHCQLLLSSLFYEAFSGYKYILIYHLDALVFSDQLAHWCDRDYDYVGPPWIQVDDAPYADMPIYAGKVGNGGFSLRKVDSFLKVINSSILYQNPSEYWQLNYASRSFMTRTLNYPKKLLKRFNRWNNVRHEIDKFPHNEDCFWVNRATHYYPEFKIPSVDTALHFGFEYAPDVCFEKIGALPFGCHAWPKYNRAFWEPYLLE
jgi:Protein of unknown function (DUF5672)